MCGDPWLKNGCATNFETRPRFRVIDFHLFTVFFQCNFVLCFFAGRNAAGCSTKYILWIFKQRPAAGATFQCLDRRQKKLIPSIWKSLKNKRYTFIQKQHIFWICYFLLSIVFVYYCLLCSLSLFYFLFIVFYFHMFLIYFLKFILFSCFVSF